MTWRMHLRLLRFRWHMYRQLTRLRRQINQLDRTINQGRTRTMPTPDLMNETEVAKADVIEARELVDYLRKAVAGGREGAGALTTAEFKLHVALKRLDEATEQPEPGASESPAKGPL